ncbi:RNA polymerase subunit sigma-24 [Paenibacillus helianthi]|uniref:RNA polymerase subunit sigma-24 n=1 Tax=Paenibacillus helianthi TaxID=1349432 RepID=A0ABX3EJ67_9BACL|nr:MULTISPECIES: sigma-70 family RNA polymerase sigma factor [Paenibacillus]OKP84030.1 RNA polymerase subunit sigma-24 [Paenibacillus helianthi]OKP89513.1 RNA polymerase subunit sigma-24 [Paenibacillus sp. P32E]
MEPNSLDELYQIYVQDIYIYLRSLCHDHHLAEDLMQETFYRAYLYLENCPEDKIKPWLFRVAYNAFVDDMRKAKRSIITDADYFNKLVHPDTTEGTLLRQERLEEVALSVDQLPERQRHALLLHEVHGMSYFEASEIMAIGLSQYKILVFRARQTLREVEWRRNGNE